MCFSSLHACYIPSRSHFITRHAIYVWCNGEARLCDIFVVEKH
jgi:hypothetical protein